jgi:hypothetical protein
MESDVPVELLEEGNPAANSSEVSSQSTLPSLRAMKLSRLAAIWIVRRESAFAIVESGASVAGKVLGPRELWVSPTKWA